MHPDKANLVQQAWSALAAGDSAAAAALCEQALAEGRAGADVYHALALSRWGQGESAKAIELLTAAAEMDAGDPRLNSDLGVLRYQHEDWSGAEKAFAACLRAEPADFTALQGHAESLLQLARYEEARQAAQAWDRAAPGDARPPYLMAQCFDFEGRLDEAVGQAEQSLQRDQESWRALALLASIRQKQALYELCLEYTQAAARLRPESGEAQARLAVAFWEVGELDRALEARGRALELGLTDLELCCSLNFIALHDPRQTARSLLDIHRNIARAYGASATQQAYANSRDAGRRLRVGYLSGEFMSSPAYCFLVPWLSNHDASQVETCYYSSRPFQDAHTSQYRRFADHWRDVSRMTDALAAQAIRDDQIDILVDLSGHFAFHRLGVFAHRPAPVQVSFPHYPGTTGSDCIDYLLTDIWTTPEGCDDELSEKPYRLPSGCLVYKAPPDCEPVSPLPALANGHVTFGLFQRPGKLHAAVWDAIAAVLAAVPDSRLLMHSSSRELDEEGSTQRTRLLKPLEDRGISAVRVLFKGPRPTGQHLAIVAEADIALDTFPYNGQTTTCDCLWMGVPVVTLRGASYVSRVAPALLDRIGLGDLASDSPENYIHRAVELANDREGLALLRSSLRGRMKNSSLTDGERLAVEIEAAYREMWAEWCAKAS
jgi:predicted O-linked N-acetylglucosamine transferase (SPINDLY family)